MGTIGEFEYLVLLAILRQGDTPYANRVREDLEVRAKRAISRGALYRTLDRLEDKGLIEWELEASATPARGGHPMRKLHVTERGLEAARASTAVIRSLLEGLDPVLRG